MTKGISNTKKCKRCGKEIYGHWNRQYCDQCRVIVHKERALEYYYKTREKYAEKRKRHDHNKYLKHKWEKENDPETYKKYKAKIDECGKRYRQKIRSAVLKKYGGDHPKCAYCGEDNIYFLTIDHIKNDGAEHRKQVKNNIYQWLLKNEYMPDRFQILCANCNFAKQHYGINPMDGILEG